MKIAILALGTQGDVQPYIALGSGLKRAGHAVRLISHTNFGPSVHAHGLEFWPVQGDVQAFMATPEMRALLEKGNFLAISAHTAKQSQLAAVEWTREGLIACQGVDLLITGVGGLFVGLALAEKLNLALLQAYVFPFTPTSEFPGVMFPQSLSRFGGTVNRLSHSFLRQMMWQGFRQADALARTQVLELPTAPFLGPYKAARLNQNPVLYGFSPSVIAPPVDWPRTEVTGYWFLEPTPDWTPPPALSAFLEAGPPPVYVGFGSMGNRNPQQTAALVLEALQKSGQRAVMLSGWSGMSGENLPDTVHLVNDVPHAWLFPRMAAVVHHGGAGTTAAGLRAGIPNIVIPFFGDQGFWGQRVLDLGVGPAPTVRKQLSAERLARALEQAVSDPIMQQKASALGAKIRAEDGLARAVEVIEALELKPGK